MDAHKLRLLYHTIGGLTDGQAAELAGKTGRQWRRYLSGVAPVPLDILRLFETRAAGALGTIHPDWEGWRLVRGNGHLVSPDGEYWTAAQLRGLFWHHERLAAERAELRATIYRLEAQIAETTTPTTREPANDPHIPHVHAHSPTHPFHRRMWGRRR